MVIRNNLLVAILLLIMTYLPTCAQRDYYYGSNIDSIQQNVIDVASIDIQGLKVFDKIDDAVNTLGGPNQKVVDIDEVDGEKYTTLYYGKNNKTFFDFHHSTELGVILIDFNVSDSLFSVTVNKRTYKVGENVNKLRDSFPKSYEEYTNNEDPYKVLQVVVLKNEQRMGLEILFLIKEGKIYNISTRYDE